MYCELFSKCPYNVHRPSRIDKYDGLTISRANIVRINNNNNNECMIIVTIIIICGTCICRRLMPY